MIEAKGVMLGNVFTASGARGFFGEGYWHHGWFRLFFPTFNFAGSTFIAKTVTMQERMPEMDERGKGWGNLPLSRKDLQPIEMFPDCINVSLLRGEALNSVGLTGLSADEMFELGIWQEAKEPIVISFMALCDTREGRRDEILTFCKIFKEHLSYFSAPVALQINIFCPNTQHNPLDLVDNAVEQLEAASILGIPVGLKINVLTPIDSVKYIADTYWCDFIELPNTLPYGAMPERVDWEKKYGAESPLKKYGGGGYSGPENFELALEWIKKARNEGIETPIICGGVSSKSDVSRAYYAGANAVAFARITMSPFHAWKVKGIIQRANNLFGVWR